MLENYKNVGTIYDNRSNNSKIFEVKEKDGEEHYAVKLIGPLDDSLKYTIFNREINALKKLNKYKNIVTLYHNEIGTNNRDNKKYGILLLELVDGKSLDKIEIENLDDIEKYKISIGIIEAVLNAHNNSIIHRDIKPSNVMVEETNVKIIDFGISKIKSCIDEGTVKDFKSKDYCAPEVALRGESSELSDIYSIGAVIYYLFTGNKPPQPQHFEEKINKLGLRGDFKELLVSMIKEIPDERESDLEKLKSSIEEIIKKVNSVVNKYYFNIDSELFQLLKRKLIIKKSMSFYEFTKSILPNDFKNMFGLINNNNQYEFLGEKYIIKCIYEKNIFYIFELNTVLDDEKIRFKKKALNVIGKLFFNSGVGTDNNNDKLDILLDNFREEYNSNVRKNNLFYDYFKTWRSYLIDSIEHEKVNGIGFSYNWFKIEGNRLTLEINEFVSKSVDEIKENTKFLIQQSVGEKEIITRIGEYDSCEYIKGKTYINININKMESITKIKNLLNLNLLIKEDYIYKIISYQRQLAAINILQEDNYECKNLKEIILDIKEPRRISELKNVNFKSELMNEYQQSSIYKFMTSENISLIQGPPGTGKTTVINEVIYQILNENIDSNERPKILVVSQSHPAVDNILEGLIKKEFNLKIFRVGDEDNISEEISNKFTADILKKNFINDVEKRCKDYSENLSEINLELEENSRLKNILNIQKEWLERIRSSDDIEYQIINDAEIVAGTCIGFISNPIIKEMLFDYVIIDEAAKATTPELLVSIIKAKKILLVGDHKQLPPYIENNKLDWVDNKTIKELRTSLFTNLYGILPDTHKEILRRQYRMHPNIGDLISKTFYDGEVASGVSPKEKRHKIKELEGYSIIWYDTSNMGKIRKHKKTDGKSFYNICEAEIIKEFIKKHTEIISQENINVGVITGYSAQKDLIRRKIRNYNLNKQIDVNTVDAFQGREDDIIIYSPVRSSDKDYRIGFQKESERINVAFSRAKVLLVVVGDIDMYSRWGEEENKFPEIVSYIRENPNECLIVDCSKEKAYAKLFREFNKNITERE